MDTLFLKCCRSRRADHHSRVGPEDPFEQLFAEAYGQAINRRGAGEGDDGEEGLFESRQASSCIEDLVWHGLVSSDAVDSGTKVLKASHQFLACDGARREEHFHSFTLQVCQLLRQLSRACFSGYPVDPPTGALQRDAGGLADRRHPGSLSRLANAIADRLGGPGTGEHDPVIGREPLKSLVQHPGVFGRLEAQDGPMKNLSCRCEV